MLTDSERRGPPRPQEQPREVTGHRDLTSLSISNSLWPFSWSSCLVPGWRLLRTEEIPGWCDGSLYEGFRGMVGEAQWLLLSQKLPPGSLSYTGEGVGLSLCGTF